VSLLHAQEMGVHQKLKVSFFEYWNREWCVVFFETWVLIFSESLGEGVWCCMPEQAYIEHHTRQGVQALEPSRDLWCSDICGSDIWYTYIRA
jgi:hypothetical protein